MSTSSQARSGHVSPYIRRGLLTVALAHLCGCASPPIAEHAAPRPLGADFDVYAASKALPSAAAESSASPGFGSDAAEPQGVLALHDALAAALLRSPSLAAYAWEVRSREARALQAGLAPNPELNIDVEDFGGDGNTAGFGASQTTLLLSQRIETAGKRSKRRAAATLDADVASWEYEAARLRVFAQVQQSFFEVIAAQQRLALSEDLVRVAEASEGEVRRLVSRGATPRAELTRATVETSAARVDVAVARRALEGARAELAATWGGLAPRFARAEGPLEVAAPPPDPQSARTWLARNPDLRRWDREVARREAAVALEDARRIPDVTAGIGPRWLESSDDTAIVAAVSVPIPVFDRNQGARAAARSDLRKAEYERRAVHARLSADLASAYQELAARFDEEESLRNEILPRAKDAFEQVRRGYTQGLFRNVDVLDAQRRLFELHLREIEALRAYRSAATEFERITGTPLSGPGSTRP